MAEPNLINTTSCLVENNPLLLTTSGQTIAGSRSTSGNPYLNKSIKVVSLYLCNYSSGTKTANLYMNNAGSIIRYLAYQVSIPANTTLVVITKDAPLYLEEYDSLDVLASATQSIHAVCSFEIYDDA